MIFPNNRKPEIKKPIIVMRRTEPDDDEKQFDVVCGLGRIEAAIASGETTIRSIIANESHEELVRCAHLEGEYERTTD